MKCRPRPAEGSLGRSVADDRGDEVGLRFDFRRRGIEHIELDGHAIAEAGLLFVPLQVEG